MRTPPTPKTLTPQARLVLDYMLARPDRKITPLAAHTFLGVASLTARIAEIRAAFKSDGEPDTGIVHEEWMTDNFKRRAKAYWLTAENIALVKERLA